MTDDQINQAIAEACGWEDVCQHPKNPNVWVGKHAGTLVEVPNFCGDLNDMYEAERMLKGYDQIAAYVWHLENRAGDWSTDLQLMATHATARQRAEAFLKALGKWEEVQE
jgi:hypothetical protein